MRICNVLLNFFVSAYMNTKLDFKLKLLVNQKAEVIVLQIKCSFSLLYSICRQVQGYLVKRIVLFKERLITKKCVLIFPHVGYWPF